jgi:hypothetical protein
MAPAGQPVAPMQPLTAVRSTAPPPVAPPASQPSPAGRFLEDLDTEVSVELGDLGLQPDSPVAPADYRSPVMYVPPPSEPTVDWPGGICTAAEAEDALQRALHGAVEGARPLHDLAMRTLDAISDLERTVLAGEPQPFDAAPIRRAAAMRLRVAEALASAPPAGCPVDAAALSSILGEIDALLAEVAPLLANASEELAPALETIRNTLVSEAIDFSEAAQRASTGKAEAPPAAPVQRRATAARIIENYAEASRAPEPRRIWPRVWLAVAFLAVGGYHLRNYLARPMPVEIPTVPGAPEGLRLIQHGNQRTLIALPGRKVDPQQMESFRAQQALKGVEVRELAPGLYALVPAAAPAAGGTP